MAWQFERDHDIYTATDGVDAPVQLRFIGPTLEYDGYAYGGYRFSDSTTFDRPD